MVRILRELNMEPATPAEAREISGFEPFWLPPDGASLGRRPKTGVVIPDACRSRAAVLCRSF